MIAFLFFALILITTVVSVVALLVALLSGRSKRALNLGLGICGLLAIYLAMVATIDLSSPQTRIARGNDLCFDDFCYAVVGVETAAMIKTPSRQIHAHGKFVIITIRVTNKGLGRPQAEPFARLRVWSRQIYYDGSSKGLAGVRGEGRPVVDPSTRISAGASYLTTAVYDIPVNVVPDGLVVDHGVTPDIVIIGATEWFHGPKLLLLK